MTWKRILATTDFSPFANQAVNYAHALAEFSQAELHVLHVTSDVSEAVREHGVSGAFDLNDNDDNRSEWLRRLLGETGTVKRVEAVHVGKDVAETIVRYARTQHIDLVVMATHGRSGLKHFILGSVVEKVLRSAPCPVLAFRQLSEEIKTPPAAALAESSR
jgi:nucleotide-binding universal stress UspA family protein